MKTFSFTFKTKKILGDTITPVSIYLKLRDQYPNSIMLEGSDYHTGENSFSYVCLQPVASFTVDKGKIIQEFPDGTTESTELTDAISVADRFNDFINAFKTEGKNSQIVNGLFGYTNYDGVQYFESIKLKHPTDENYSIPDMKYCFYKYIISINHFKSEVIVGENLMENESSDIDQLIGLLNNQNLAAYPFTLDGSEKSNLTDEVYKEMVKKGKDHCFRGDVIQIVLSRQFSQKFKGDEFNVYRALRMINPSPYLYFFDFGGFKIFGSSPEAQLTIKNRKAYINPIAGTYRRTGDDIADKLLAEKLADDPKENAEHIMLVDLARNDLSRNCKQVKVEAFREIQFYSHVLHMVSKVSGEVNPEISAIKVMGDSFPAGTLSGAPKFKAMELIDSIENQNRGYYGGCLGYIGFNGDFNHAIMIRSFLSKNNTLFYQAGAGIVSESIEESELKEVNNKLAALKSAIDLAKEI